jgi:hypothetical protein
MCSFDWSLFAEVLSGLGTLLVGLAAILTLSIQFGYRKKSRDYKNSLKLLFKHYKQYMASEEGIVLAAYPEDATTIISRISNSTGLDKKIIKTLLDELKDQGKI